MKEEIALAFIFAYIINSVVCEQSEMVEHIQNGTADGKNRSMEVQHEKAPIFPAVDADASLMLTNHRNLYENEKHQVAGTTFTHRKIILGPVMPTQIRTIGGQLNYLNKPTDVLLTLKTQKTNNNPAEIGVDGKVNLYTSPMGMVRVDGNLGYTRQIGVPSHLANQAWGAGLDINLINAIFLRGSFNFRL